MHSTAAIRTQGFRRWYDRALIRGHVHLLTAFLGLIVTRSGVEMLGLRAGPGTALAGATCPACATCASFDVIAADSQPEHEPENDAAVWMKVRCRRCRHEWII